MSPLLILLLLATLGLSFWAQGATQGRFKKWSRVNTRSGLTGAQVAAEVLRRAGVQGVTIEAVQGRLSDHYDPRSCTLRLSPEVHDGRSVAAFGVAAHEAGHAIQHANKYLPLEFRSLVVPTAGLGSSLGFPLMFMGLIFHSMSLAMVGLVFFAVVVVFQLITVPVEFDASRRAIAALEGSGLIQGGEEAAGVKKVLTAAGLTYVAAALTGLVWLLHYGSIILGRRN